MEQRNSVHLQLAKNNYPVNRLTWASTGKILAADARGNVMALPPKFSPNYSTSEPPRRLKKSVITFYRTSFISYIFFKILSRTKFNVYLHH